MGNYSKKQKPEKPYPEFPPFAHATGRWAKKVKGKFHYIGRWDDPMAALVADAEHESVENRIEHDTSLVAPRGWLVVHDYAGDPRGWTFDQSSTDNERCERGFW